MPEMPHLFNRLRDRAESFKAFVQFYDGPDDLYRLKSLATITVAYNWVDQDAYEDDGILDLIPAAVGHTASLQTRLTTDLASDSMVDYSQAPHGTDLFALGRMIHLKESGERVQLQFRQVFTTKPKSANRVLRREGVLDVQGISDTRPQGGEIPVTIQGRVLQTNTMDIRSHIADEAEQHWYPGRPETAAAGVRVLSARATARNSIRVEYSAPLTVVSDAYAREISTVGDVSRRYTRSTVSGGTIAAHVIPLSDQLPASGQTGYGKDLLLAVGPMVGSGDAYFSGGIIRVRGWRE